MKTTRIQLFGTFGASGSCRFFLLSRFNLQRTLLIVLCALALQPAVQAQRCLDLSITALMGQYLHVPGDAATNFKLCKTTVNDHGQSVIINHGQDLIDRDTMLNVKGRAFAMATVAGTNMNMPSSAAVEDAQALAQKLQSMTPEQQRAWAMQQAAQQQQHPAAAMLDDPQTAMLVQKTYTIANVQLPALTQELASKVNALAMEEQTVVDKLPQPDKSGCPGIDKQGTPSCACVNGVDGKYWNHVVAIHDRYGAQAITLLNSYLPQIKALVSQVEANISTLKNGDAVKDPKMKGMLLGAQSATFGNAFSIPGSTIERIRTEGTDAYVNKVNCDKNKYDVDCL